MPSSTPGAMSTVIEDSLAITPWPWHLPHGERISRPVPWQSWQVEAVTIWPRIDWRTVRCWPVPAQRSQTIGSVPGAAPEPPH